MTTSTDNGRGRRCACGSAFAVNAPLFSAFSGYRTEDVRGYFVEPGNQWVPFRCGRRLFG